MNYIRIVQFYFGLFIYFWKHFILILFNTYCHCDNTLITAMSDLTYEFTCLKTVKKECADLDIPWGEDWTFKMLTNDLIDAAQALIKFAIGYFSDTWSENTLRGVNSLRCVLTSAGENIWNFLAAGYWSLVALDIRPTLDDTVDFAYKQICTCQEDIEEIARQYGGDERSSFVLASCSEEGANKKLEA